ncbi:nuclear receptor-binding protein 2 isoform X10 [Zalophus californianus]|uniref:Nuclear receptor-binding protein 2 isoform X10 n=1 Tax=Zalophus californianus TaxID=9704 RepID=A0A6J2B3T8_ZALCA|nr:nuclear receptor-binding protein 2 isoform X10 [Zalophus californianus]
MAAPEPAPRRGREREREDESEDESDILEESPCGRWQKRREQEKIQTMFEQLVLVDHPNIVKLHKYWLDASEARARPQAIPQKDQEKPQGHERTVWHRIFSNALPDDLRSPIRAEREELRNLHFFPPEYGEVADGTAVDIFSFGMCALEMAVLEIQANGDTRVTEEAITRARHSLSDPNMREFILSCLARDPSHRPSAHNLLFHRVLFEVHSLKLLAAHCFIQHQYLMPENVVEEKTKAVDLHAVLAEIPRPPRPPLQWRYSEVSCLELDKFLEDVRNGIYPLMNFAAARPLGLPRVLAPPPEEAQKAKTPTPEPFDSETRKVIQMQCNLERSEDKARWHPTVPRTLPPSWYTMASFTRMTGPSWLPSWKAPSSSTLELSRDLAPQPPGTSPGRPHGEAQHWARAQGTRG